MDGGAATKMRMSPRIPGSQVEEKGEAMVERLLGGMDAAEEQQQAQWRIGRKQLSNWTPMSSNRTTRFRPAEVRVLAGMSAI